MSDSHKLQRAAVKVTLDKVMKYIDKNPQENICKMLSVAEKLTKSIFPAGNLEKMKKSFEIMIMYGPSTPSAF